MASEVISLIIEELQEYPSKRIVVTETGHTKLAKFLRDRANKGLMNSVRCCMHSVKQSVFSFRNMMNGWTSHTKRGCFFFEMSSLPSSLRVFVLSEAPRLGLMCVTL